MFSSRFNAVLLLACCLIAVAAASIIPLDNPSDPEIRTHLRIARSPQHGSVVVTGSRDQQGRQANVQYNHNLWTSRDGRGSIDAYANAGRNWDTNRNNYGGGIQGKIHF